MLRLKSILCASLLSLMVMGCSSCAQKTPEPSAPPTVPTVVLTAPTSSLRIAQDNWELTLPSSDWVKMDRLPEEATTGFANAKQHSMFILATESYDAGDSIAYAMMGMRGIKAAGATITSVSQTNINGHKFVVIQANIKEVSVWTWVTVSSGYGYGLSCGGKSDNDQEAICTSLILTLRVK